MSFNGLLDHYQMLIRDLEAEKAAYRTSQPVFAKLDHAVKNVAVPLMKRAELGRLRYVSVYPKLPEDEQKEIAESKKNFDEKPAIRSMIWSIYHEIAPLAQELAGPRWEKAPVMKQLIVSHWNEPTVDNPLEFKTPFEKGSWGYDGFYTNLGEPLHMVTAIIGQAVLSAKPEELKEKEQIVGRVHALLSSKAGPEEKKTLPPKYKDKYEAELEESFGQVEALTGAFWKAERLGEKPAAQILQEMSKTVEAEITRLRD